MKQLHERATRLTRQLEYFAIEHVRRELNRDADALANVALDSGNVGPASVADTSRAASQSAPVAAIANPQVASKPPVASFDSQLSFRARLVKGTLVPLEPLDLPEGALVDVDVRLRED